MKIRGPVRALTPALCPGTLEQQGSVYATGHPISGASPSGALSGPPLLTGHVSALDSGLHTSSDFFLGQPFPRKEVPQLQGI